ncbi:UNVERIFIED_CONTAM: hypothetical protein NCL1_14891 [Trichonephila clavipes]
MGIVKTGFNARHVLGLILIVFSPILTASFSKDKKACLSVVGVRAISMSSAKPTTFYRFIKNIPSDYEERDYEGEDEKLEDEIGKGGRHDKKRKRKKYEEETDEIKKLKYRNSEMKHENDNNFEKYEEETDKTKKLKYLKSEKKNGNNNKIEKNEKKTNGNNLKNGTPKYQLSNEKYNNELVNTSLKNESKNTNQTKQQVMRQKRDVVSDYYAARHLCIRKLLNLSNYVFECRDNDVKHFACINSNGFIENCYDFKNKKKMHRPLCIKKTKFPYVIICSTSGLEKLCFGHKDHKDRLLFCNDARRRVCFNQGLSICKIPNFNEPKIRRRRIAELSESDDPRKPDVNCQNCEVDIKMFVREGEENATPKILINITDIDPVDVLMDDSDDDNDV